MAISFPTSLDAFTNPTSSSKLGDTGVVHHEQHSDLNDAVEALEVKVGINSSADTSSLDYKIANMSGVVPVGGIIMWSGTIATIPATWALCDGTANAPGPDLRDKFIVGATSDDSGAAKSNITGSLLQSGGSNTHTHDAHAVTQPVVADHSITQPAINDHSITQPAVNAHSVTQPVVSAHVRGTDVALSAHALGTNVAIANHSITQPAINAHSITQPVVSAHVITQPVVSAHAVTTSNCRTSASAAAAAVTAIANHTLSTNVAVADHTLSTNVALDAHALGTNVAVSAHTITQPAVDAHSITQPAFNDHTLSTNVALSAHSLGTSVALSAHSLSTSVALSSHSLSTPAAVSAHSTANNIPAFFALAYIQRIA